MSNAYLSEADQQKIIERARDQFPGMFTLPAEPTNALESVLDWLRSDIATAEEACVHYGDESGRVSLDLPTLRARLSSLLARRADPVWRHSELVDMHTKAIEQRDQADAQVRFLRERLTAIATYRDDPICDPRCASFNSTVSTTVQIAVDALARTA